MQQVVNCILRRGDQLLLLQKPRRGWYVAPGGKVERGESLSEAVIREVSEETGLTIAGPDLRGVFTVILQENGRLVDHWMLHTFYAEVPTGDPHAAIDEGTLHWVPIADLPNRPMAEGDRHFFQGILESSRVMHGKFIYTPEYQLLSWREE